MWCVSAVERAMEKTSTSSPPTLLAIDARSLMDAATIILANAFPGRASALSSATVVNILRNMYPSDQN
ncbi:MAG: hypothetical protein E6K79_11270 [Candidatus Eisenbacteria bacterium]|uniref:Uncharacterized protein n=1 Tax=Eiseniibacteriota bacterium TaxID=2212470 RepID=A0A538TGS2_UNCEI|nr:MAG: hypothetical protein E6K79_11270 [Candidatus Eisenbacteria bacterium]